MPYFKHEVLMAVPAVAVWLALKDQNTLFPKLMPEAVASIEVLEGEGCPGSVRIVKFGPMAHEAGFVKEVIRSIDHENYCVKSEELEGGHVQQFGFTNWAHTVKIVKDGEEKSKAWFTAEYEGGLDSRLDSVIDQTKEALTRTFKVLEEYLQGGSQLVLEPQA